jgi:hypothetical protein
MHLILVVGGLAAGALVTMFVVTRLRADRRAKDDVDLGSVSGQWINEQRLRSADRHH